jgi:hypothetical protein
MMTQQPPAAAMPVGLPVQQLGIGQKCNMTALPVQHLGQNGWAKMAMDICRLCDPLHGSD